MKIIFFTFALLITSSSVFAKNEPVIVQLSDDAAKIIGEALRKDEKCKNTQVQFSGGPQVTSYSLGNLTCYFLNEDDSVSCAVEQLDLSK